jgi:formylglycine-generating enzyme required for sulfatase activity
MTLPIQVFHWQSALGWHDIDVRQVALRIPAIALTFATVVVVWTGLLLPPPYWLLRYGLAPGCEPTGEVLFVEDIEFVVIGPGIARIGSSWLADEGRFGFTDGDLVGRVVRSAGIELGEPAKPSPEMPVHWVQFPKGYALAKSEVTNSQYELYRSDHERSPHSPGDHDPVVCVTFDDASAYCAWLTQRTGHVVRLPSESEWEAACRGGSQTEYCFGEDQERLVEFAWYQGNSNRRAHEVRSKRPNAWGLWDLHGNVWEWCEDRWHGSYMLTDAVSKLLSAPSGRAVCSAPTDGSAWLFPSSPVRVVRGGGWSHGPAFCRSSFRWILRGWSMYLGFRPALDCPGD